MPLSSSIRQTRYAILAASTMLLVGCGVSKQEATESWESQERSAFQEFRDRHYDDSIRAYEKALSLANKVEPQGVEVATTLNEMAVVYTTMAKPEEAAEVYDQSVAILDRLANGRANDKNVLRLYCDALDGLGKIKEKKGELAAAEPLFEKAVSIARRVNNPSRLRELVFEYKSTLLQQGKDEQAQKVEREFAHVSDSESVPDKETYLQEQTKKFLSEADNLWKVGRTRDADKAWQEAYNYASKSNDLLFRGDTEGKVALYLYTTHQTAPAENAAARAIRDLRDGQVEDRKLLPYLITFSTIEHDLGKHAIASRTADLAMKIAKANYEPEDMETQQALMAQVNAYCGEGRWAEAEPLFERSYAITKKRGGAELTATPVIMHTCWLGNLYWMNNKHDKAAQLMNSYIASVSDKKKSLGLVSRLFNDYGNEQARNGQYDESKLFFNAALKVAKSAPDGAPEIKRANAGLKALETRKTS